ncbi:hypothetical protein SAMN05216588_105127 [Pseudomonas flavescens]|uniref:Uncharacterized protein n=1 Tax=Phytopseudomonas flavescens TaxID=29435 RepID=A0A1G8D473_9GAMM|nr:hypothetical protein SAMN05216588_105127 [Pseudomonas flavescens]
MESLCRGTSRMDAAGDLMGQGWPFQAGPRNDDEMGEPQRSWGRMSGLDLLVSFGGAGHPGNSKRNPLARAELNLRTTR